MSFTTDLKEELITLKNNSKEEDLFELEGIIRLSSEVFLLPLKLEITLNSKSLVRLVLSLLKKYFDIEYELISKIVNRFNKKESYTISITKGAKEIIDTFHLIDDKIKNENDNPEHYKQFIRGAFLAKGSVNDPAGKNSHLEIASSESGDIIFIQGLLVDYDLNARISKRNNYLVLYLKSISEIGSFLYLIGATSIMEYYENTIIQKEIIATAKRSVNLDIANQTKTNNTAHEQLRYIQIVEENYKLADLDEHIIETMNLRKLYPEYSLSELLDVVHDNSDPYLTKSRLNHRFRKIKTLAQEILEIKSNK
ncbi:MAG: DNA-binding protein WhiA [Acholeplasmatales bacterium]|nr:DNA-binding protein WhiA [Acholeplasmatales bacterium]